MRQDASSGTTGEKLWASPGQGAGGFKKVSQKKWGTESGEGNLSQVIETKNAKKKNTVATTE